MRILEDEIANVTEVSPNTTPQYGKENPLWRIVEQVEATELAAERNFYLADSLQYLFPVAGLSLYGPAGADWQVKDPRAQDNKNDFQKQNIRELRLNGMSLARGYARAGDWCGAMLRVGYAPPDGSPLAPGGRPPGSALRLGLRVGERFAAEPLLVPYNPVSARYELELWSYRGPDLRARLDEKGRAAYDRGELVARPDLVSGELADFHGPAFDHLRDLAAGQGRGVELLDVAPDHALHPLLPLRVELAWGDAAGRVWDSRDGQNYVYEFNMSVRGWRNYLAVGRSANPHGGVGTLDYRNLYSNYFGHEAKRRARLGERWLPELGRVVQPWNFDARGVKPASAQLEPFMAVDYMDLHILRPGCGIGIHRHRDNQEAFMLLSGKGLMLTGDWCEWPDRQRAFEVRTLQPGDLALIKGGQLHALLNPLDENITLFMFGGYD
ncbi:MAG: cupin domain-containing protein [Acidobacteria bacterium]|nr:cupin domain-containing protein [Acidobacteriota bacterium]